MVSKMGARSNGFWEKLVSFFFAILQVYLFLLKQFHIPGRMANCFYGVANPVLFLDRIGRRKRTILEQLGSEVLLTDGKEIHLKSGDSQISVYTYEKTLEIDNKELLPSPQVNPESLAYIIYTSGSTGEPYHSAAGNTWSACRTSEAPYRRDYHRPTFRVA